jgi:hypothetical protein
MTRILFCAKTSAHQPYWADILAALRERGDEVLVTYSQGSAEGESPNKNYQVVPFPIKSLSRIDHLLRETRTAISYRRRKDQSFYYFARWTWNLPNVISRIVRNRILGAALVWLRVDKMLGYLIEKKPPNRAVKRFLRDVKPDFVLASPANHFGSLEIECVKAARKLKIPTGIVTLSWDNLTTKGLFHAIPDILFVWNTEHKNDAESIHDVPGSSISISGAPFFEKWLKSKARLGNEREFLAKLGLEPGSRYVLYVGSTRRTAKEEDWLVRDIREMMDDSPALRDIQLVIRPHPANVEPFRGLSLERAMVWPEEGVLPSERQDIDDFRRMLTGSVAVVGINTSAMIDAIVLGVPTVAFLTERYAKTQAQATHFRQLMNSGAVGLVESIEELNGLLVDIAGRQAWQESKRQDFIERYIAPHGREYLPSAYIADRVDEHLHSAH